jgi:hypothetical protein
LAVAFPWTTSVILPGSLLRVLIFTSFLTFLVYGHQPKFKCEPRLRVSSI